jgi:hypothetical protein
MDRSPRGLVAEMCGACRSGQIVGRVEAMGVVGGGGDDVYVYEWSCLNCGFSWTSGRVESKEPKR